MDVYKAKIQSDGSLDKLKLRIVVRGDLQNKEMVGDTWSPTASMRTLKYFLADAAKHKARVHQLDFIGAFLQANVKNRVFVKLDMRYAAYFPEYTEYFGIALKLLKSMYGMTKSGKLFADELTELLIKEGFIQSQCQMSIYYKYAPDGSKLLFYLMLMIVYIGTQIKILENGLLILWERDSMWTSWDMHIGSCQ